MSQHDDANTGDDERESDRDIPLPDVDGHEYTRLLDCLDHAREDAVTSEEEIQIRKLKDRLIEHYETHDRQ